MANLARVIRKSNGYQCGRIFFWLKGHMRVSFNLKSVSKKFFIMTAETFNKRSKVNKWFLWTAPRCVSTAFERSIRNLKRGKVFHEPYSYAYYFGPERISSRYASTPVDSKATIKEISKDLSKEYGDMDFMFAKDMAYHIEGNFDILLQKGLSDYKHSFLIRDPKKAVPSLYKASRNPAKTGWDYFDPEEVGFRQLLDLYNFIVKELSITPVIIDADDLLESPEQIMEKYCEVTGLSYQENMTKWDPISFTEWGTWSGWHETVIKSSGIVKKPKSKEVEKVSRFDFDNEDVVEAVNASLPCYKILHEKRLRLSI